MPSLKRAYSSDSDSDSNTSTQEPVLFNWMNRSSIQHHCGAPGCTTPLKHETAKKTCWGPHMIPCHRYHQALFIAGHQQKCTYCDTEDKAREVRLAQLQAEAQLLAQEALTGNSGLVKLAPSAEPSPNTSAASTTDKKPPATKKEKKAAKQQAKANSRATKHAAAITRAQLNTALSAADNTTTTVLGSILAHLNLRVLPKTILSKPAAKSLDKIKGLVAAELQAQRTLVAETAFRKRGFEAIVPRSTIDAIVARNAVWDHGTNVRVPKPVVKAEEEGDQQGDEEADEEAEEQVEEEQEEEPAALPTPPATPPPEEEGKEKAFKRQRLGQ
ncbi:hypothetical protein MBLNU457_5410t1 [Dothideomycetes sp. NU457]